MRRIVRAFEETAQYRIRRDGAVFVPGDLAAERIVFADDGLALGSGASRRGLAIGIADAARQRDDAVVSEHVEIRHANMPLPCSVFFAETPTFLFCVDRIFKNVDGFT